MPSDDTLQERRNTYDVTNQVNVASVVDVRNAVAEVFKSLYPTSAFDPVWLAFHDFERLFNGEHPEYHAVETTYHDIQHTLDMCLALIRLIAGYEKTVEAADRLGPQRTMMGLVTALFHDAGYLRHRERDMLYLNGAEFTQRHVTRSSEFLAYYLPQIGFAEDAATAAQVVHFTGYEMSLDSIELDDPRDSIVGHLLGTADLMAQMADRCYLEKCRDRLFPEFVLGGIAIEDRPDGALVRYRSGRDLLVKTLDFYQGSARHRLEHTFNRAYRYIEAVMAGKNLYIAFIRKNLSYLETVIRQDAWDQLRRKPPLAVPNPYADEQMTGLAIEHIQRLADAHKITVRGSWVTPEPVTTC
jgi:hypothetical protein